MAKSTATTEAPATTDADMTDEGQAAYDARVAAQSALNSGEKPKAKRTTLTPEQKIARLEAELKAARDKAEAKANKAKAEAVDKRAKLIEKRDALNDQIAELDAIIGEDTES